MKSNPKHFHKSQNKVFIVHKQHYNPNIWREKGLYKLTPPFPLIGEVPDIHSNIWNYYLQFAYNCFLLSLSDNKSHSISVWHVDNQSKQTYCMALSKNTKCKFLALLGHRGILFCDRDFTINYKLDNLSIENWNCNKIFYLSTSWKDNLKKKVLIQAWRKKNWHQVYLFMTEPHNHFILNKSKMLLIILT